MPNDTQRIEIIAGHKRRRRYTAQVKVGFVEQTMQPGMTVSAVARINGLSLSLLFGWRRRMAEGGQVAVQADDEVVATSRMRELEARVRDLERLLGRTTLDVEVLKEALAVARKKSRVAVSVAARGLFPVKVIADVLGVARSNLVEQWGPPAVAAHTASPTGSPTTTSTIPIAASACARPASSSVLNPTQPRIRSDVGNFTRQAWSLSVGARALTSKNTVAQARDGEANTKAALRRPVTEPTVQVAEATMRLPIELR